MRVRNVPPSIQAAVMATFEGVCPEGRFGITKIYKTVVLDKIACRWEPRGASCESKWGEVSRAASAPATPPERQARFVKSTHIL